MIKVWGAPLFRVLCERVGAGSATLPKVPAKPIPISEPHPDFLHYFLDFTMRYNQHYSYIPNKSCPNGFHSRHNQTTFRPNNPFVLNILSATLFFS
jgi:hypothetical protein